MTGQWPTGLVRSSKRPRPSPTPLPMIRIREIIDPDLRRRIVEVLADRRGCSPAAIPEWFELDDADLVDLLNDMQGQDDAGDYRDEPRM